MYSGVQVVVVCCDSWEGVGCVLHVVLVCVQDVVLLLYVCMCSV